jgi:hypothetical protein
MGKSNLTMGDSGKYSYTVTCGAEVLNQKFALKVGLEIKRDFLN